MQKIGDYYQEDYYANNGGLNNSDSPFIIKPGQAVGGANYDYETTGAVKKRLGASLINNVADAQLKTLGLALRQTKDNVKNNVRAAGTKIQTFSLAGNFINLTEDTTAVNSDFLTAGSTQPVARTMYSSTSVDILWLSGGGMPNIYGVYSDSKVTANGVATPTGSISTNVTSGTSTFATTGTYFYAVLFRKAGTQALGNVALDKSATIANTTDKVTIDLSTITNIDTTKFDKIYIYRSAVSGTSGFTTGDLIAQVNSNVTSYDDTGTSIATAQNIPRAGNTILDNSPLPTNTYNFTTLFKRRLVTASGSSLYISDLNKSENWPLHNYIQLASGGEITGLGVISFNTPTTSSIDEMLVVFKEKETWIVTGTGDLSSGIPDWQLKFIDNTGTTSHSSIVSGNGYMYWMNERGFFMWDGAGKPMYISKLIADYFKIDGDIDKTKLNMVWGAFYRTQSEVIWVLSSSIYGEQKFALKLDLRLTLPDVGEDLTTRIINGIFVPDSYEASLYAGATFNPNGDNVEYFFAGDSTGFVYRRYNQAADNTAGINFSYETNYLDQGMPNVTKYYDKVVCWVEALGTWNLQLDYWAGYKNSNADKSSRNQPIATAESSASALWDLAFWDVAFWDSYQVRLVPVVFNLSGERNNTQGESLKLRFVQNGANEPVNIYGWSILFKAAGVDK